MNIVHLIDCMEFMKTKPDNYYDLAIVDPPYGIKVGIDGKVGIDKAAPCTQYKPVKWDNKIPDITYFNELFRISKNQVIWGINYFTNIIKLNPGRICWNKDNTGNFSDCELAYQSFKKSIDLFKYRWNGMLQGNMKNKEKRIHPTQKPVALYKWLLQNYAKPDQKIFDSHVGSGSIRISCHDMGFDFEGCEIDVDYWQAQEDRYNKHIQQGDLFSTDEYQELIYDK